MIAQADSEQFRMLSMMIEDTTRGMCIYQATTAREQQLIAYELKDTNHKNTLVIDMADYADNITEIPADIQQFKKILDAAPESQVVVVCNLQLCGLWVGDTAYIEKFNYMRDQLMECNKMWVFGMTPYFAILLSQRARDLYTYMMYNCSFVSKEDRETFSYDENKEYAGNIKLLVSQFEEYKRYLTKQMEDGTPDLDMAFHALNVWLQCADYLDYTASEWIKGVMSVMEKSFTSKNAEGKDITLYKLISKVYLQLGDYTRALMYIGIELNLVKTVFQKDSLEVAVAYEDMAYGCLKAEKWDGSREYCDKALNVYKKLGKEYSLDVISLWNCISTLQLKDRNFEEVIDIYKRNIQIIMEQSNESNYSLLLSYNNLGRAYEEMGNISEALCYMKKAQELARKYHRGNAEAEIGILNNIANLYHRMGDLDRAKKTLIEAKQSSLHSFGEENEATAHIYHNLAAVYNDLGQWYPAEKYYKKAIAIRRKVLGEMHTDLARSYMNLAGVLMQSEFPLKVLEAYKYLQDSLRIRETIYPNGHRELADCYAALAQWHYKAGDYGDALENSRIALKMYTKLYGKDSQLAQDIVYNIELIKKAVNREKT